MTTRPTCWPGAGGSTLTVISYVFLHKDAPQNYSAWRNAEADKALDDARLVTDMAQRKAIYEKLTKLELEDEPILYLYHRRIIIAHTTKLEGYKQMPDGLVRVVRADAETMTLDTPAYPRRGLLPAPSPLVGEEKLRRPGCSKKTGESFDQKPAPPMLSFLAKRLAQIVPTLFFVSILIFSLQHLLHGDPALVMAGEEQDPAVIAQIRQQYRLDRPIPVQYFYWVKGVLSGDFGESLRIKVPVRDLIEQKLPVTLQLGIMAMLIAFSVRHSRRHHLGGEERHVLGLRREPVCALGHLDAEFLARHHADLPVLHQARMVCPASGYVPLSENWRASLASTIMPAFVLGQQPSRRSLMRHTRAAMLQVLDSDYVRTARAKGISETAVILKHALRNALTPVITLGALELGTLFIRGLCLPSRSFPYRASAS